MSACNALNIPLIKRRCSLRIKRRELNLFGNKPGSQAREKGPTLGLNKNCFEQLLCLYFQRWAPPCRKKSAYKPHRKQLSRTHSLGFWGSGPSSNRFRARAAHGKRFCSALSCDFVAARCNNEPPMLASGTKA